MSRKPDKLAVDDAVWQRAVAREAVIRPLASKARLSPADVGLACRQLELGRARGRSAVCLGQSARSVVSVDAADPAEAAEWARRFGIADRLTFLRGGVADVVPGLPGPFGLVFVDTGHDAASVDRDISVALPLLGPGGLLAFHDYPDPGWPDVRRVVDDHARRLGWKRVAQADFLGVFRT